MKTLATIILSTLSVSAQISAQSDAEFQRWEVDTTRSTVGFDASSTLHDFSGTCSQVGGEAHAILNSLGPTSGGIIWCQANGLDTDNEDRDANMFKNLGVIQFPKISFSISDLQGQLSHGQGQLNLAGTYSIHGVDKARSFPIEVQVLDDGTLHVTGRSKFLLSDHNVVPESVMGIIGVDDEIEAWLDIFLTPKAGAPATVAHWSLAVEELVSMSGVEQSRQSSTAQLCMNDQSSFLDFDGYRSQADASGVFRTSLSTLQAATEWPSNNQSFEDSRERMKRLQAKYEKLSTRTRAKAGEKILQTMQRLQENLANAPTPNETVEVIQRENQTIVRLGQRDWIVFDELDGDAIIPSLFATLPDLPKQVQQTLRKLHGTPSKVLVHSATAAGTREIVFRFELPSERNIPSWNLTSALWTVAGENLH